MYISSDVPCRRAVAVTHELGLFAERIAESPWTYGDPEDPPARPADDTFWEEVADRIAEGGPLLLQEGFLANASRWHRVTIGNLAAIRGALAPRSRLLLWPDLSTDIPATLTKLQRRIKKEPVIHPIGYEGEQPLLTGVLPDTDGVLRARWTPW